jgi:transglutaminase-like putative cysteine protease
MPRTYRFLTAVLGITGSVGLVATGEINPVMAAGGIAVIPGYYRFLKGRGPAPSWVVGMCSVLTLAVFLFDAIVSGDVFLGVAHLTITFQAIKSYDLKEPWDHLQVYFVSLLQMVIASELSQSLVFGVVFVVFLAALVAAMVFSHFVKEGHQGEVGLLGPIALISILSVASTVLVFIALPRTAFTFFGKSHVKGIRTSGFSDRVDFGSLGEIKLDPEVIMRVELGRDLPQPYYWRGLSLDYFDGTLWRNTAHDRNRIAKVGDEYLLSEYDKESAVEQRIYLEPIDSDIIFGLQEIRGIRVDTFPVQTDHAEAVFLFRKSARRAFYSAYSIVRNAFPGTREARYLQIPSGLERVRRLALDIAAKAATDKEKALMIERYLKRNYSYSLSSPLPGAGMSPVEDFLFHSKRGHCEHFAASMVLMLRGVGIPSRIVNGFYGGEKNIYGGYIIVRQSDAHAWVEALIDNMWTRFDPTPSVPPQHLPSIALFLDSLKMKWSRYVVGFRTEDQRTILRSLTAPFMFPTVHFIKTGKREVFRYLIPSLLVGSSLIYIIRWRMRRKRCGFVSEKYLNLRATMGKGGQLSPSTTPREIINKSARLQVGDEVREFIRLYEGHRFGGKQMNPEDRKRYSLLLRTIKKGLKGKSF